VLSVGDGRPAGIRYVAGAVGTTAVSIGQDMGIGGLYFVHAYNASNGAQGWWLLGCRYGTVTTISSNNGTGLTVNFSLVSSVRLRVATASGSLGNVVCWGFA